MSTGGFGFNQSFIPKNKMHVAHWLSVGSNGDRKQPQINALSVSNVHKMLKYRFQPPYWNPSICLRTGGHCKGDFSPVLLLPSWGHQLFEWRNVHGGFTGSLAGQTQRSIALRSSYQYRFLLPLESNMRRRWVCKETWHFGFRMGAPLLPVLTGIKSLRMLLGYSTKRKTSKQQKSISW